MTKISKNIRARQQITLTGEEEALIALLKVAVESKLGFKISMTKVVRIALNKLHQELIREKVISSDGKQVPSNSE